MIKKQVTAKFEGTQDDILELIRLVRPAFNIKINSRFIQNSDGNGVHCFVLIEPKDTGVEPIAQEAQQ